jgi:hypothetical protein
VAVWSAELLNDLLVLVPTVETAAKHTPIIIANMTAYSTAVGPSSDFTNFETTLDKFAMITFVPPYAKRSSRSDRMTNKTSRHRQSGAKLLATAIQQAIIDRRRPPSLLNSGAESSAA